MLKVIPSAVLITQASLQIQSSDNEALVLIVELSYTKMIGIGHLLKLEGLKVKGGAYPQRDMNTMRILHYTIIVIQAKQFCLDHSKIFVSHCNFIT